MYRHRPVSLALIGLFIWVTACTSYKQIELSEIANYEQIEVILHGGDTRDL